MSNISDCIINMQFIHVEKHNLKIKKLIDNINKLISCKTKTKINNLKNKHMQDMISILLVYSVQ